VLHDTRACTSHAILLLFVTEIGVVCVECVGGDELLISASATTSQHDDRSNAHLERSARMTDIAPLQLYSTAISNNDTEPEYYLKRAQAYLKLGKHTGACVCASV
jgi:hypothetical protein